MRIELETRMPRALEHLLESRQEASMQGNTPNGTTQMKSNGIMRRPDENQTPKTSITIEFVLSFHLQAF